MLEKKAVSVKRITLVQHVKVQTFALGRPSLMWSNTITHNSATQRQKRRYCVLDGHSWLVIYKDRTKKKVKAVYLLQQILDVTATVPSSHVFEIRMTRDDPPLVLASRDQADMLDWMGALNGAISFANGPAPHEDVPSQGKL
ncbi:uncharacterized protein [Littorina saxatilis]|uniref:uncharacterized protein isoform X4 n=1 Tax=Littorina saxatilis TaxID=31220 RepID=UPI0038B4E337